MIAIENDYSRQRLVEVTRELMNERKRNHELRQELAFIRLDQAKQAYKEKKRIEGFIDE